MHKLLPGQQKGHDLAYWLPLQTAWLLRRLVEDLAQDPSLVQSLPIPLLYANRMGRLKWATPTACALLGLTVAPQSTPEPQLLAEQTSRELLARYKVPGPPTFLWIGADGEERRSQRITGEVDADTFLQRWTTTREAR